MPGPWEKYAATGDTSSPAAQGPWQKYSAAPKPAGNALGAGIEGFGQGASMGYLPQLQAAVGSLMPDPNADLDAKLKAQGFDLHQGDDSYVQLRDENLKRQEALQKSNPLVYGGSQLAGLIATAPIAEGAAAKALPSAVTATRLGKAVGTGAVIGAIQNPGDDLGKVDVLQAGDRLENAGIGALAGGAADGVARGLEKGAATVKGLSTTLQDAGEANALRSVGAQKSQMAKLNAKGRASDVAKFVVDNDLGNSSLSGKELLGRVNSLKSEAANEIGQVSKALNDAGEKGAFDRKALAEKMRTSLLENVGDSIDADSLLPKFEKYITDFEKKSGPASVDEVQGLRRQFDDRVDFSKRQGDLSENEGVFKGWRRLFSQEVENKATELGGDLGNRLAEANKKYSMAAEAGKLAQNKANQAGNNAFGLSDRVAGATFGAANAMRGDDPGSAVQNGLIGLALGAAGSKALRTYGGTVGTKALLGAANAAERLVPAATRVEELSAPTINKLRLKALETDSSPRKKLPKSESSRRRLKALGE